MSESTPLDSPRADRTDRGLDRCPWRGRSTRSLACQQRQHIPAALRRDAQAGGGSRCRTSSALVPTGDRAMDQGATERVRILTAVPNTLLPPADIARYVVQCSATSSNAESSATDDRSSTTGTFVAAGRRDRPCCSVPRRAVGSIGVSGPSDRGAPEYESIQRSGSLDSDVAQTGTWSRAVAGGGGGSPAG